MNKVAIVYWTQTDNTKLMAELVLEGVKSAGAEADCFEVSDTSAEQIAAYDRIALGCPSMGDEVLEETSFQPFYDELADKLTGKHVGLFGSYGWGDGEWMRNWENDVKTKGALLVGDKGVMANYEPDDEAAENCKQLGADLAK